MSKDMKASTDTTSGGQSLEKQLEVSEQRRKDAQAALTPIQQDNARLKAELEERQHTVDNPVITPEKQAELDDLKFTDPEKWRQQMNTIDSEAQIASTARVDEATKKENDIAKTKEFFEANPTLDYNVVKQVLPNAIQERYNNGELTIDQVLEVGKKLLEGATVASVMAPDSPNLGDVAGKDKPSDSAKVKQVEQDWKTALV